jgi:hypothetical protein
MDSAYISTLSALAGTAIGGVTSFATSWITQHTQSRLARLTAERARRDELYSKFLEEVARLYSHAATEEKIDHSNLVGTYALRGRILPQSSPEVAESADAVIKVLIDLYIAPNRSDEEWRKALDDKAHDPMIAFFPRHVDGS